MKAVPVIIAVSALMLVSACAPMSEAATYKAHYNQSEDIIVEFPNGKNVVDGKITFTVRSATYDMSTAAIYIFAYSPGITYDPQDAIKGLPIDYTNGSNGKIVYTIGENSKITSDIEIKFVDPLVKDPSYVAPQPNPAVPTTPDTPAVVPEPTVTRADAGPSADLLISIAAAITSIALLGVSVATFAPLGKRPEV